MCLHQKQLETYWCGCDLKPRASAHFGGARLKQQHLPRFTHHPGERTRRRNFLPNAVSLCAVKILPSLAALDRYPFTPLRLCLLACSDLFAPFGRPIVSMPLACRNASARNMLYPTVDPERTWCALRVICHFPVLERRYRVHATTSNHDLEFGGRTDVLRSACNKVSSPFARPFAFAT